MSDGQHHQNPGPSHSEAHGHGGHSHSHSHVHVGSTSARRLVISTALTLAFVVGEAVAGYLAHSLALLSDAGHNLADALALILSWYAVRMARKPADEQQTFGYHRVGILIALVNAASLVVIALFIFIEGAQRLRSPEAVEGGPMIVVAAIAMILNGGISLWLREGARNDLNIRSAYLHMLGDALSALGVVLAGIIVSASGASAADPIVSLLIGVLILYSSWEILAESIVVLLEGVPRGFDLRALKNAVERVPGVCGIHHVHVWTLGSGIIACSCHVVVNEQSIRDGQQVLRAVSRTLTEHFGVAHTTIQLEVEGCEPQHSGCVLEPDGAPHRHDHG